MAHSTIKPFFNMFKDSSFYNKKSLLKLESCPFYTFVKHLLRDKKVSPFL